MYTRTDILTYGRRQNADRVLQKVQNVRATECCLTKQQNWKIRQTRFFGILYITVRKYEHITTYR